MSSFSSPSPHACLCIPRNGTRRKCAICRIETVAGGGGEEARTKRIPFRPLLQSLWLVVSKTIPPPSPNIYAIASQVKGNKERRRNRNVLFRPSPPPSYTVEGTWKKEAPLLGCILGLLGPSSFQSIKSKSPSSSLPLFLDLPDKKSPDVDNSMPTLRLDSFVCPSSNSGLRV